MKNYNYIIYKIYRKLVLLLETNLNENALRQKHLNGFNDNNSRFKT
jgi:hypothetical protein